MKKITVGMFSLAAMVGMAMISAQTVRAEDTTFEGAKQESGVKFGEMGGLNARGGSSAVRASGGGVSRPTLTAGKLNKKAMQGSSEIPNPEQTAKKEKKFSKTKEFFKHLGEQPLAIVATLGSLAVWAGLGLSVGSVIGVGILVGGMIVVAARATMKSGGNDR